MAYVTNETERQDLKKAINNIVDSLTRQAAEKDLQKEIKTELKEKYGIPPRQSGRLAKMVMKAAMQQEVTAVTELEELYEQVSR